MSTTQNLYSVGEVLNHVEYSEDMSSESEDDDDFTHTVTPGSDANDSSDSSPEDSKSPSNTGMFIVHNSYY